MMADFHVIPEELAVCDWVGDEIQI